MGEVTNEVYEALNKYFAALTKTGYRSYSEVNKLLVMTFIEELLYGPLSQFITEADYVFISNSLECLYGSCMMPYPTYKKIFDGIVYKVPDEYRITEDNSFRITESSNIRVKS